MRSHKESLDEISVLRKTLEEVKGMKELEQRISARDAQIKGKDEDIDAISEQLSLTKERMYLLQSELMTTR